jgi:hypothetical protein
MPCLTVLGKKSETSSSVSLPPSTLTFCPPLSEVIRALCLGPTRYLLQALASQQVPRAIIRRPAEWAAGTGNSLPAACKSLFMGVWGHPSAAGHDHAMMHAAPVCVAPARCCARALYSSVMHLPAAACTHNSWQPGCVRGSPSLRHNGHPRAPREAIHALDGRCSTRFKIVDPSASNDAIHAIRGRRSTRSKGGDPSTPEGGDSRAFREAIHALQRR